MNTEVLSSVRVALSGLVLPKKLPVRILGYNLEPSKIKLGSAPTAKSVFPAILPISGGQLAGGLFPEQSTPAGGGVSESVNLEELPLPPLLVRM